MLPQKTSGRSRLASIRLTCSVKFAFGMPMKLIFTPVSSASILRDFISAASTTQSASCGTTISSASISLLSITMGSVPSSLTFCGSYSTARARDGITSIAQRMRANNFFIRYTSCPKICLGKPFFNTRVSYLTGRIRVTLLVCGMQSKANLSDYPFKEPIITPFAKYF